MTPEYPVRELAEALLPSPTARLGDDVDPACGARSPPGLMRTAWSSPGTSRRQQSRRHRPTWRVLPLADMYRTPALDAPGTDVLVLALPHTLQTAGLVAPELLRAFDGVHLVNIGRGSAIRTDTRCPSEVGGRAGPRLLKQGC